MDHKAKFVSSVSVWAQLLLFWFYCAPHPNCLCRGGQLGHHLSLKRMTLDDQIVLELSVTVARVPFWENTGDIQETTERASGFRLFYWHCPTLPCLRHETDQRPHCLPFPSSSTLISSFILSFNLVLFYDLATLKFAAPHAFSNYPLSW